MFQNLFDYLEELERSAESTQEFLFRLRGGRRRLVNKIVKSQEAVKTMSNETNYVASLKPKIIKEGLKAAKQITQSNLLQALRDNYEFDTPPYSKAIYEAVKDDDTYMVRSRGAGFNSIITIDINLDKTAGRLNRWAAGVKAYRKELEVKIPKDKKKKEKAALQASRAWARIFDERGGARSQFAVTIRRRLQLSGALAPFWQLLDKGDVPMASDRGGYPTPKKKRTNFVHESQQSTNKYIEGLFTKKKEEYNQLFNDYYAFLEEAQVKLRELDGLIDQIYLDVRQVRKLQEKFGEISKYIDSTKLEKAVQLIRQGLLTSGRVELTAKGARKRVRPSVETIKELLY